jgi:predicted nucleotide-binding protein (sugar kinase/HSP70/actin superfamily)
MTPTPQSETLKQIQAAWEAAQNQVTDLRAQVEHMVSLAQAKVQQNLIERDLDRAFRDLGEAVWAQVSKGKLQLPTSFNSVMKALEAVTQKIQEQNASINDLLAEGNEIANRLKKSSTTKTAVASREKKR